MNLYHYDPATGEHTGESQARLDPMASKRAGENRYLIPAHATTEPPPATAEHETAVWNDNAWETYADWRGHVYWLADGSQDEITALGIEPPADALDAPPPEPPKSTAEIIRQAESDIDTICDAAYTDSLSRDARYNRKLAEAMRYRDADYPHPVAIDDYPYLVRESAKRTETKRELADLIILRTAAFDTLGSEAEAARAELQGIGSAADPQTAADEIVGRIQTLVQPMEA